MSKTCGQCGNPLRVLSSVASDPHDEPAYYCPCWPTDWTAVALGAAVVASMAGVFWLMSWALS